MDGAGIFTFSRPFLYSGPFLRRSLDPLPSFCRSIVTALLGVLPHTKSEALAALGRRIGLTNEDFAVLEQVRDKKPAEPMRLE